MTEALRRPAAAPVPAAPSRWNRPAIRAAGWLVAAVWAGSFPLLSGLAPHRLWGLFAAAGYLLAAGVALREPASRAGRASALVALTGAVVLPLAVLVACGQGQSEVMVIERSADLLVHSGSPYLPDPRRVEDFTPYLPGMTLWGLPRVLLGATPLADARLWCAAALMACLVAGRVALRPTGRWAAGRWTAGGRTAAGRPSFGTGLITLTASPVVALPLCVSGVDLPLTGACCLGLAFAARGRPVAAGAALALACSLKWSAWPALPVALALLAAVYGGRAAVRCALVCLAGTAALVLPAAVVAPHRMIEQVLAFPTGRAAVPTPASSPLPGRLLADLGPAGWFAAVALLVAGGAVLALSLLLRPPASLVAAADRLALGLTLAFTLAPAGRFGYLALPLVLVVWSRLAAPPRALVRQAPVTPGPRLGRDGMRPATGDRTPQRQSAGRSRAA
ncbi:hypothetical protein [Kitasatospora sp. HPMI-4]|uniref:hypothetical protein n=1 Tax=Kitasatospora sp. HPMI-4 TaxID=3448443 RepID=UPI003F19A62E